MDPPIGPETLPQPSRSGDDKHVIPPPVIPPPSWQSSQSSEELEVCIGFKLLYCLLTNYFSTGYSVTWSLFPQEVQGCFHCAGYINREEGEQGNQGTLSQSAGASLFSEGHTGTPIIVTGASPNLQLCL
jgi:hypothetical protein